MQCVFCHFVRAINIKLFNFLYNQFMKLRSQVAALPLLWLSLAFLGGILLADSLSLPWGVWLALAAICLFVGGSAAWLARHRPGRRFLFLLPFLFFLGAWRLEISQPVLTADFIGTYNDAPASVWVTGYILKEPDVRDTYANLVVDVTDLDTGNGDFAARGRVLIRLYNEQELEYGQLVRARGLLQTPPENEQFSYKEYLARQGIHSYMSVGVVTVLPRSNANPLWQAIYWSNAHLYDSIYAIFPDPEASLLSGILLGNDNGLSQELQDDFRDTGTTHIIAISGFNIAIIAGVFFSLFSRLFGLQRGAIAAIAGITFYTLLVGAEASVVRAALMGSLGLLAKQIGRRTQAISALTGVALLMALLDPFVIWDVGFQLSFAATAGLILYAQPLADWAEGWLARWLGTSRAQRIIVPLSDVILLTLAAQLTTLPVIAYHFQRISIISLIANPFILPAQPAVMILGGLAAFVGAIYQPLGQILAYGTWPFPAYTIRVVEWFASLPNGVLSLDDFSLLFAVSFYAVLLAITFFPDRLAPLRRVAGPVFVVLTLLVFSFLTWRTALNLPDGRLHLTFLDVGTGDAILVRTPEGRFVLINGGASPAVLTDQLGRRLPPFNRALDALVVASTQENQVAGLPRAVERFMPRQVYWSGNSQASFSSRQLDDWLTQAGVSITVLQTGNKVTLGGGAELEVLASSPRGAILLISMGSFRALLPVGSSFEAREMLENGHSVGEVSLLLLAEGGYAPANPPEWLAALNPQLILLSVEAGDPDGLPDQALLDLLAEKILLRTDQNGWVDVSTNGDQMWIMVEKE